ncbi:MAG: c-type cytochrome [Silvibacterium sp.]|nr:c-type cytochrome [Silvibacterium sp.]
MKYLILFALLAGISATATGALCQEAPTGDQNPAQQPKPYQKMTAEERAASTRAFLGLGAVPDKAAAALGAPLFNANCAVCHGRQARGAMGPSLITSDEVLGDDHGEKLVLYLKDGRPGKGMPSFAAMPDEQLKEIAEFLHLQVEDIANRGAYHVLNILVGNAAKGQGYVEAHCMSCHTTQTFAHIGSRFRSSEQLQKGWIWPPRTGEDSLAITATVKMPTGSTITGHVTQVSDFRITVVDQAGQTYVIERGPGVEVQINDPLAAHQKWIMTLTSEDMHNVTAYLETLK